MRNHHIAVIELINTDPLSAEAAQLRAEIADLEQRDPTLIAQRLSIFAAHVRQIGMRPPADLEPKGILLT